MMLELMILVAKQELDRLWVEEEDCIMAGLGEEVDMMEVVEGQG